MTQNAPAAPRKRRYPPDRARERILAAAEAAFLEGGVDAVKIQPIAATLGITDAAIHYHFKNREGLLEALLKRCGRRLKDRFKAEESEPRSIKHRLSEIAETLQHAFTAEGYAKLALWLYMAGWSPKGRGMLEPLAAQLHEDLHKEAPADSKAIDERARFSLCLLHEAIAMESTLGNAFLRSVGLKDDAQTRARYRQWLVDLLTKALKT